MRQRTVAQRKSDAAAVGLSASDQDQFVVDPSPTVRRTLANRRDLSLASAQGLAQDLDRQVREQLATNPACPEEVLLTLLEDNQFHVRWEAARNRSATRKVLLDGLAGGDSDVGSAIAQLADSLDEEVIQAVISHELPAVRETLAEATSSAALLERLAEDDAPRVRRAVALSDNASLALVERLAADRRAEVRRAVAARQTLRWPIIETLAHDKSADVRWNLMMTHPVRELAEALLHDPDELVRMAARGALR